MCRLVRTYDGHTSDICVCICIYVWNWTELHSVPFERAASHMTLIEGWLCVVLNILISCEIKVFHIN
jgi:hypothetical protein